MIGTPMRKQAIPGLLVASTVLAVLTLTGCGTSTEGSRYQDQHGVAQDSRFPAGQPKDPESPALASSSEPKVREGAPKVEGSEKPSTLRQQPPTSREGPRLNKP